MKNLFLFFLSLIFFATVMPGCKREHLVDKPVVDQNNAIAGAKSVQPSLPEQLVTGLGGGWGSTIGPGGDLFVADGKAGAIVRVDPETGDYTTFASGLPQLIPAVGIGGISDVAFLGGKAYALVTLTILTSSQPVRSTAFIGSTVRTVSQLSRILALIILPIRQPVLISSFQPEFCIRFKPIAAASL